MKRILIAMLAPALSLSGCVVEHELHPSSPLPRGIAHDPRMHGMGPVRVTTKSNYEGFVATVRSLEHRGSFKVRGTGATMEPHSSSWTETYNGETDIFELFPTDYHYVRVIKRP